MRVRQCFQQIGSKAYKPGLETTHQIRRTFRASHQQFKTIHIAGTNGKGSCSHTIAAVLQSAGYRVGYSLPPFGRLPRTHPHQRRNDAGRVCSQLRRRAPLILRTAPSFVFELTTAMAFRYFADQKVDVAVIEVGMGGRLDCTNIIHPDLCVITNISFDHMQYLGNTLTKIAKKKQALSKKGFR